MTATDSPLVTYTIPNSTDDNPFSQNDTTDAEHEDTGYRPPTSNGDSHLEDLKPSTSQDTNTSEQVANSKLGAPVKKTGIMSVDPLKKANGSPPTPTVKKIINSGTFGAGSLKPTATKGPTSAIPSAQPKPTAPALKKPTTSAPAPTSKPTLATSTSSKPAVSAAAAPSRRASVVPTRTVPLPSTKPSLSASTNAKPTSDVGAARTSVVSPTGSVGSVKSIVRPRASVSEAVKKAPVTSRPSITTSSKVAIPAKSTPVSRSSAAPGLKTSRPTSSISSVKELKEDENALEEAQAQLEKATKSLEAKSVTVSELESRIEELEQSLAVASGELESRSSSMTESEKTRDTAESELREAQKSLAQAEEELQQLNATLQSLRSELEAAKSSVSTHEETVRKLESRIDELEVALSSSKKQVELLEQKSAAATSAVDAASVQQEALLVAQANFKAISEEIESLKAAHATGLQDKETQIAELQDKLAATETMQTQLISLKTEKEESANKLSELEVEILELKEAQDELEDTRDKLQRQISTLEDDLKKSTLASDAAAETASVVQASHLQQLEEIAQQHEKELEANSTRYDEIVARLDALNTQLSDAVAAKERVEKDIVEKQEEHTSTSTKLEQAHAAQLAALATELEKVSQELQNQEALYNAKVDTVKNDHAQLLQEAFERAKDEAAQTHSEELQTLRSSSNSTIEQIQKANQVALNALTTEHESALETEANDLKKTINKLSIELRATQDDLSKAKTALEASHTELERLSRQRDAARAKVETTPALTSEHADEIARLSKELSVTKDDLAAVTDMLNLTKSSMAELSDKQTKELEGAAQARADEVLKLRAAHDLEVQTLAEQKSGLLVQLSDLEGELQTARASFAQQISSPRSNGNSVHTPASPGVTKEELTKMHEAHNLKIYDLQAGHEKAMKHVKDELEAAFAKMGEMQQDIARKAMEIQYLEQDQDENQEHITRLKEDLERMSQEKS